MLIISSDYYKSIRVKLVSSDNKIVKNGIQQMLKEFEQGRFFEKYDILDKQDFNANIHKILKSDDYDVRKWLYHLLCYYNPKDDYTHILCKKNLTRENDENISWVTALLSSHAENANAFTLAIKDPVIHEKLSDDKIKIISCAYRKIPFYSLEKETVNKIVDADDPLSQIWLTKIFANNIRSDEYKKNHKYVNEKVISNLFYNDDETVRKYSIWAFAQGQKDMFRQLEKRVDFSKLDNGQLKWYYTCLFSDKNYIQKNLKDAISVLNGLLWTYPVNIREGIINGLNRAGFIKELSKYVVQWFESNIENDTIVQVPLLEYILKNYSLDDDFKEILISTINNIDNLPEKIKFIIKTFLHTHKGKEFLMENTMNIQNYGQMIIGDNNMVTQLVSNDDVKKLNEQIDSIRSDIKNLDFSFDLQNDIEDIKNKLKYLVNELLNNQLCKQINNLSDNLTAINDTINSMSTEKRKTSFGAILQHFANIVTIFSVTQNPVIYDFINNFIDAFKNFLSSLQ